MDDLQWRKNGNSGKTIVDTVDIVGNDSQIRSPQQHLIYVAFRGQAY